MNLIKPKKLNLGDTIAIIATSGNIDTDKIKKAKKYFEGKGYKVKLGKNIEKSYRYLAGSDADRLEDLHEAFSDNEVSAIICARGGYGAIRLINKIDYDLIKNNPKIFCGFSDITALNAMFLKRSSLITFSGPMAQSDFSIDPIDRFTEKDFFDTLTKEHIEIKPIIKNIYKKGEANGILFGGNLATLTSICGQDFIPDEPFIFFTEDLNEETYKIDRYFTQLLNIEHFRDNIRAIILGEFLEVDNNIYLDEYFSELAAELNIPTIKGFPITHGQSKTTVPYGAAAQLKNDILKIKSFTI